jgi:hypothetical protein
MGIHIGDEERMTKDGLGYGWALELERGFRFRRRRATYEWEWVSRMDRCRASLGMLSMWEQGLDYVLLVFYLCNFTPKRQTQL